MKSSITKQMYTLFYLGTKHLINTYMNLREKVNALFAKHNVSLSAEEVVEVKQMVEAILADGTSIYLDSDTWAPGVRVLSKDAEGNEAVADGEYTTAEGVIVVVADGLLVELKPMVEEPEVEVEVEAEKQSTDESLSKEVEGLLSLVAKLESELAEVKKTNANLSSEVTKLSAQPAATSIKEVKQAKVNTPSKPYHKMSAEERFLFNLKK